MGGLDTGTLLFLSLFALVPAALLALVPPAARWTIFFLGLALFGGFWLLGGPSGPDNPRLIYPLAGLGAAVGALITEAVAFPVRRLRWRRAAARHDAPGRGC